MIIQLCGLSGSGKTTIAYKTRELLTKAGITTEVIDGDEYRKELCSDLGFSQADRNQNIRRLAFVANKLSQHKILTIICAINPYDEVRKEVAIKYKNVKTVFINCNIDTLMLRDTKGLYKRSQLPDNDPNKVTNLTGVNDPFELPLAADLTINTHLEPEDVSVNRFYKFIIDNWQVGLQNSK